MLARRVIGFDLLSERQIQGICSGFQELQGIPNTVGAVDGTLIPLSRPSDPEGWYNRKGYILH